MNSGNSSNVATPAAPTTAFYDEAYYRGHYGGLLDDADNYRLLSLYWREVLFVRTGLDPAGKVLDFGCGVGQVSAAMPDTVGFDFNSFSIRQLRERGRVVVERREEIPTAAFDYLLSSHSLEHSPSPADDLREFHRYMKPTGRIVLVLPIETEFKPTLQPDSNQHLQCWTFQTITNLLLVTGWRPTLQRVVYGPWMLRTLGKYMSDPRAVEWAVRLGQWKRGFASMLTIAERGQKA
jgi:ubiquinone/menaquinone biosynthesis C-methylase UbiE